MAGCGCCAKLPGGGYSLPMDSMAWSAMWSVCAIRSGCIHWAWIATPREGPVNSGILHQGARRCSWSMIYVAEYASAITSKHSHLRSYHNNTAMPMRDLHCNRCLHATSNTAMLAGGVPRGGGGGLSSWTGEMESGPSVPQANSIAGLDTPHDDYKSKNCMVHKCGCFT